MRSKTLMLLLLLTIVSCGWSHVCTKPQSYKLGMEKAAVVGSEIVQLGCLAARWEPLGLNRTLFRRIASDDIYYEPCIDKELLYSGMEGDILHITYRQWQWENFYRNQCKHVPESPIMPFTQQVYYDLKKSKKVLFQDWEIHVIETDNERIRFKVVREPQPSQSSISCRDCLLYY